MPKPSNSKKEKIIENMNATPIIDTNVEFNIPRSPTPFDEKKHNFKCTCCGKGYSKQNGYFQKSNDVLFQANNGYLPWCKECTDRYTEQMTALYSNNELAQAGPCPLAFVVYGVAGADPPQIEEHPVAFAMYILSPNN